MIGLLLAKLLLTAETPRIMSIDLILGVSTVS